MPKWGGGTIGTAVTSSELASGSLAQLPCVRATCVEELAREASRQGISSRCDRVVILRVQRSPGRVDTSEAFGLPKTAAGVI